MYDQEMTSSKETQCPLENPAKGRRIRAAD